MSRQINRSGSLVRNQRGQGLIEYLIIVALMGVATIAIMRIMGETVTNRFASITTALQGKKPVSAPQTVDPSAYKKRDLGDFMSGAASKDSGKGDK